MLGRLAQMRLEFAKGQFDGLGSGDGFTVDASLIVADANKAPSKTRDTNFLMQRFESTLLSASQSVSSAFTYEGRSKTARVGYASEVKPKQVSQSVRSWLPRHWISALRREITEHHDGTGENTTSSHSG